MLRSKTDIGTRDERVTIQTPAPTKDEYGQPVPGWDDFATVWAKVDDRSGGEGLQANQITAYMNTTFNIRFLEGVNETMRILRLRTGEYYNIRSIKRPDRNRSLDVSGELMDEPILIEGEAFTSGFTGGFT